MSSGVLIYFQKDVSVKGDDLLGDLMEELHKGPTEIPKPAPVKLTKKKPAPVTRYQRRVITTIPPPPPPILANSLTDFNPILFNLDISSLGNSVDPDQLALRSQLIWICTVFNSSCYYMVK